MIKTLRITSVLVGVLAVACLVVSVVYGVDSSTNIDALLARPGTIEVFEKHQGALLSDNTNKKPQLVLEAEQYALLLNPPPPRRPEPRVPSKSVVDTLRPRTSVAPKFELVGICYNAADPNASLAFIKEPGVGQHWVRQDEAVGLLVVKEIRENSILCLDGDRTEEMTVMERQRRSLLDTGEEFPAVDSGDFRVDPVSSHATSDISVQPAPRKPFAGTLQNNLRTRARPQMSEEDTRQLEQIVETLRNVPDNNSADKTPAERENDRKIREQVLQRLNRHIRESRMSQKEARTLGELGRRLGGQTFDPNGR